MDEETQKKILALKAKMKQVFGDKFKLVEEEEVQTESIPSAPVSEKQAPETKPLAVEPIKETPALKSEVKTEDKMQESKGQERRERRLYKKSDQREEKELIQIQKPAVEGSFAELKKEPEASSTSDHIIHRRYLMKEEQKSEPQSPVKPYAAPKDATIPIPEIKPKEESIASLLGEREAPAEKKPPEADLDSLFAEIEEKPKEKKKNEKADDEDELSKLMKELGG